MSADLVMTTSAHFKDGRLICEWMLTGPLGMVLLRVDNSKPPEVDRYDHEGVFRMRATDLGCHSHAPMYEGQMPMADTCPYLGGPCFYDGSGLQPREFMDSYSWSPSDEHIERLLRHRYQVWLQDRHDERQADLAAAGRSALDGGAR